MNLNLNYIGLMIDTVVLMREKKIVVVYGE